MLKTRTTDCERLSDTIGEGVDKDHHPAMSRFGGGNRQEKKKNVIEKLKVFFEKYFGV